MPMACHFAQSPPPRQPASPPSRLPCPPAPQLMRKHSSGRSRVHEQCRLMILPGKVLCSNLRDESPFATAAATTLLVRGNIALTSSLSLYV